MVFNLPNNYKLRESYKERNLYYKFFAGYFFNEFISTIDERTIAFIKRLKEIVLNEENRFIGDKKITLEQLDAIQNETKYITFDYHVAQFYKGNKDRGEMSDILIYSKQNFISIECKYLSNMSYKKDIEEVQSRIKIAESEFNSKGIQVLLMKESKFKNSTNSNKENSFAKKIENHNHVIPTIILFWEDLLAMTTDTVVKEYLINQLKR